MHQGAISDEFLGVPLFPAVGIIGASSAATQATTATTLLTSAASTATSMLGSEVALAKMKPSQLLEADEIAVKILSQRDWDLREVASVLQFDNTESTPNSWLQDLQSSQHYLQQLADKEDATIALLETDQVETGSIELNQDKTDLAHASIGARAGDADAKQEAHNKHIEP